MVWTKPILILSFLILFGCLLAACEAVRPSTEETRSEDRMVDIGGYKLHCRIQGEGRPAVVFLSGFGAPQSYWNDIVEKVREHSTVITYDRAGYGKSEMGGEPKTAARIAEELNTLLSKLEIPGPYLVVGHSFGCRIARYFSVNYPDEVCGIILLDPTHPEFIDAFEATLSENERKLFEDARERMISSPPPPGGRGAELKETWSDMQKSKTLGPLSDVPLTVMTAPEEKRITPLHKRLSDESQARFLRMVHEYHLKLAAMTAKGKHLPVDNTGHNIPIDRPDAVVTEILDMLQNVRE